MAILTETRQRRQVLCELETVAGSVLGRFPAVAAAFVRAWEGTPLCVSVILEDELAGTRAFTRELEALFPGLEVRYNFWKSWRRQDGIAGYAQIYLRPA